MENHRDSETTQKHQRVAVETNFYSLHIAMTRLGAKLRIKHFLTKNRSLAFSTYLSPAQRDYIKENFPKIILAKSIKDITEI